MKTKFKFTFFFALFVSMGAASYWHQGHKANARYPASQPPKASEDSPHLKALRAIPLVKGLENPAADEAEVASQLVQIFERFADHNRNTDGTLNRGTHAKGECFKGELNLFSAEELKYKFGYTDSLISRLRKGFFEIYGPLPATLRFANADGVGRKQDDRIGDVRGFSFSVGTPETFTADYLGTHRQDFMMNSTPEFATGGIHDFLEVVKAANIATYHDFSFLPNLFALGMISNSVKKIDQGNQAGKGVTSYAHTEYWGNLPYTHGSSDLIKYKAVPCDGFGTQHLAAVDGLDPNYLQKDIENLANSSGVCFYLQLQLFDLQKLKDSGLPSDQARWSVSDWVENGGVLWDEKVLPFYTIGKIETMRTQGSASQVSCDDEYINTRLHGNPDNLPIGSIARVRTIVEETSRARRMGN